MSPPAVCLVVPYPPWREELGGGGWVDRRILCGLEELGADVVVFAVTAPGGKADGDGHDVRCAGGVPLEIRNDRRALARVAMSMVRRRAPYLACKFTAFDGWAAACDALRTTAVGRTVITSGWPPLLLATDAGVPIDVHVAHNVDTLIAASHSPRGLRLLGEPARLERLERSLLAQPRSVHTLSRVDAGRLAEWGIRASPLPLPLLAVPDRAAHGGDRVGFIGKASWPPNAAALGVLLGPVHEALNDLHSHVRFVLGGSGTERWAEHPRVERSGWVADIDSFYSEVGTVVVPRLGVSTGVSVKMLEAAEHGVEIIVPPALAEAVDLDGPWIVAEDPSAIADAIVQIGQGRRWGDTAAWARQHPPSDTAKALLGSW